MVEATFARDTLVTFGAGIAALLLVFGTLAYAVFTAPKFFKAWQEMVRASDLERQKQLAAITALTSSTAELTVLTTEVIRTNTVAFQDSSKSTDNMAKALELLTAMYERTSSVLSDHDIRSQNIQIEISKISERTAACKTRWNDQR
jgi:coenzyme F420-reducing hydrogenase alpha subunit